MWAGFVASLLLVTVAEFGDKTFFTPLILAMRHPRRWVFLGAWAALAVMTVLAVAVGQLLFSLFPATWVQILSTGVFLAFGLKMLSQAHQMTPQHEMEEEEEALKLVEQAEEKGAGRGGAWAVVSEAFTLTAVAELGDKTQVATISLAAAHPGFSVLAGATLGHGLMVGVAVLGGRFLANHISERAIHWIGGSLFLGFALLTGWELLS
ncbi:TMEM165/GDT1 family protein [Synechococcus sp. Nb3U1]|uniref:TMEM165/GDT1 family protein n=1 Tax=Synechococcus sp. Nb3U1 TaxID=1914529 RepID=UPI001F39C2ED|nr:TMEM165/GDT1 family protein [Synechococcus sp. Nb3U1]MCF2970008.1 TMEM165/GDT1 family protein [Synechococcus sp. Nb3U1]